MSTKKPQPSTIRTLEALVAECERAGVTSISVTDIKAAIAKLTAT